MSESKAKLYEFYKNIKQGSEILSSEELEIAIETLKLAQQTLKQTNRANSQNQTVDRNNKNVVFAEAELSEIPVMEESQSNKTLPLPSYDWFVTMHDGKPASNIFTGSCRKDATKGHFSTATFNYKISVRSVGKDYAKIIVNCFLEKPWYKGGGRKLLAENEFECSVDGLAEAETYLNSEWHKFKEDIQID